MKIILLGFLALTSCAHHVRVEPVTVLPIHVTVDLNVHAQPETAPANTPHK